MQHAFLILRANFSHFFRKATPDCTKEPLCKYIFSVDVYEDLIGIRSTADWAKGNADVPFMKEVKTNYAASNEADGVIIDGMS